MTPFATSRDLLQLANNFSLLSRVFGAVINVLPVAVCPNELRKLQLSVFTTTSETKVQSIQIEQSPDQSVGGVSPENPSFPQNIFFALFNTNGMLHHHPKSLAVQILEGRFHRILKGTKALVRVRKDTERMLVVSPYNALQCKEHHADGHWRVFLSTLLPDFHSKQR